jgi:hypothetical protein
MRPLVKPTIARKMLQCSAKTSWAPFKRSFEIVVVVTYR